MAGNEFEYLQNSLVSFGFERKTGSLASIVNKANGISFLSEPTGARLFRLMVPSDESPARYVDSHLGDAPTMEVSENLLIMDYNELKFYDGSPARINARVTIVLDNDEAKFSISLENNEDCDIGEVRFPWIGGFVEKGPEDMITVAGRKIKPHGLFDKKKAVSTSGMGDKLCFEYPTPLYLPFFDLSVEGGGLGYICYMEKPRIGVLGMERLNPFASKQSLSWSWASEPFVRPGATWASAAVGVSIHSGDWHQTADRFREWVYGWWKSPNPPASLVESIGMLNIQYTAFNGMTYHNFEDVPDQVAHDMDANGIQHFCMWERAGGVYSMNGSAEDIFEIPLDRAKVLADSLAKAKGMGANMSAIINVRLIRSCTKPYETYAEEGAIRTLDGSFLRTESYASSSYHLANLGGPYYMQGDTAIMCQRPNSPFADRAAAIIQKLLDLGYTSVFIDQALNNHCCFNEKHHHPSPDTTLEDACTWISDVARQVKSGGSPDSYVIGELPDLFQSQNIDLWWDWTWVNFDPEVYRYAHPKPLQMWVVDGKIGEMNKAFSMGFYISLTPFGMDGTLADRPEIAAQVKKLCDLRKKVLQYTVYAVFKDDNGLTYDGGNNHVCAYAFEAENCRSVIFSEMGGQSGGIVLDVLAEKPFVPSAVYSSNGGVLTDAWEKIGDLYHLDVTLEAYEVCVWTFDIN